MYGEKASRFIPQFNRVYVQIIREAEGKTSALFLLNSCDIITRAKVTNNILEELKLHG